MLATVFGRACADNLPATGTAFGTDIDHPVGRFDHVEIVFDDQHRIAGVDKVLQHFQQQLDVGKMQTGRRFVQHVQCFAGAALDQFAGQLDSLGFTARQRG